MGGYAAGTPAHSPENATLGGIYFQLNAASVISEKSPYIYNVTTLLFIVMDVLFGQEIKDTQKLLTASLITVNLVMLLLVVLR